MDVTHTNFILQLWKELKSVCWWLNHGWVTTLSLSNSCSVAVRVQITTRLTQYMSALLHWQLWWVTRRAFVITIWPPSLVLAQLWWVTPLGHRHSYFQYTAQATTPTSKVLVSHHIVTDNPACTYLASHNMVTISPACTALMTLWDHHHSCFYSSGESPVTIPPACRTPVSHHMIIVTLACRALVSLHGHHPI